MFSVGEFIVERESARAPASFGVVMGFEEAADGEIVLDVQFPTDRLYAFASQCLPYKEWLSEQH
jgi:hypothetical protein|tara:strand:- start:647 stop:838 length:192 start_codon:yes stop_codon:yes gene_type:complete